LPSSIEKEATPLEVIVLAGGFGTRLQGVVKDVPKPMAEVAGHPFLHHLLAYTVRFGVGRIVLSVHHMRESIIGYFGDEFQGVPVVYSIEEEPLGTGGAIYKSLGYIAGENALVLNGDTFFGIDLRDFMRCHGKMGADVTMGLKLLKKCGRYGTVELSGPKIKGFREKSASASGYINAGVYGIKKSLAKKLPFEGSFSFERDLLQEKACLISLCPYLAEGYFIDIGVPEDYLRAQGELLEIMKSEKP
jgi:D-glycero-alpha-D-manno-heptose 1-phosphate guanylyltransferase